MLARNQIAPQLVRCQIAKTFRASTRKVDLRRLKQMWHCYWGRNRRHGHRRKKLCYKSLLHCMCTTGPWGHKSADLSKWKILFFFFFLLSLSFPFLTSQGYLSCPCVREQAARYRCGCESGFPVPAATAGWEGGRGVGQRWEQRRCWQQEQHEGDFVPGPLLGELGPGGTGERPRACSRTPGSPSGLTLSSHRVKPLKEAELRVVADPKPAALRCGHPLSGAAHPLAPESHAVPWLCSLPCAAEVTPCELILKGWRKLVLDQMFDINN